MAAPELTTGLIQRVHTRVADGPPEAIIERARHVVLDWMVATSFARDAAEVQAMRSALLGAAGTGRCHVVGASQTTDPFTAAIVNGTTAHMREIDDTLALMYGHPSGVVAGVLALASHEGIGGHRTLVAIIAGYEAAVYAGIAFGHPMHHHGFEGIGIIGTLAATLACGTLLDLDRAQMEAAVGIASSTQAAGLRSTTGTSSKSLLAGTGGQRGITAALLARAGYGGPLGALEHPYGLAQAMGDHTTSWLLLPELDEHEFGIERGVFKFHSACHALHSTIESVAKIVGDRPLDPREIASVQVRLAPRVLDFADVKEPRTTLQARFSAGHIAAAYLTGLPRDASPIGSEALADAGLAHMRRRVEVIADPTLGADPFTGLDLLSEVEVVQTDGSRRVESVPAHGAVGSSELAGQWRRLLGKAEEFRAETVPETWVDQVAEAVSGLDVADGVTELTALLGV